MNMELLEAAIDEARGREGARDQERRRDLEDQFYSRIKDVFGAGVPVFFQMTFDAGAGGAVFTVEDDRYHLIAIAGKERQWRVSKDDDRPESQPFLFRLFEAEHLWGAWNDEEKRQINRDRLLVAIGELLTADPFEGA